MVLERRRGKLLELQKDEEDEFALAEKERAIEKDKNYKRRREEMDETLCLASLGKPNGTSMEEDLSGKRGNEDVKVSLDLVLGLVEETVEQRRKRELDEALGLRNENLR